MTSIEPPFDCRCAVVYAGMKPTGAREWRPGCPVHPDPPSRAIEPPFDTEDLPEGMALLPHLTERELRELLDAVVTRMRVLRSLHTAISEAIDAARLDTERMVRDASDG